MIFTKITRALRKRKAEKFYKSNKPKNYLEGLPNETFGLIARHLIEENENPDLTEEKIAAQYKNLHNLRQVSNTIYYKTETVTPCLKDKTRSNRQQFKDWYDNAYAFPIPWMVPIKVGVMVGGVIGAIGGLIAGAIIGTAAGPVGIATGAVLGLVLGAGCGAAGGMILGVVASIIFGIGGYLLAAGADAIDSIGSAIITKCCGLKPDQECVVKPPLEDKENHNKKDSSKKLKKHKEEDVPQFHHYLPPVDFSPKKNNVNSEAKEDDRVQNSKLESESELESESNSGSDLDLVSESDSDEISVSKQTLTRFAS